MPVAPHFGAVDGLAHVIDGLIRRIGAHIEKVIGLYRTAEPIPFRPVVLHFRFLDELIEIKRRIDRRQRQPVRFGYVIYLIGGNERGRSRHVLDDDVGISGDVFSPELGKKSGI